MTRLNLYQCFFDCWGGTSDSPDNVRSKMGLTQAGAPLYLTVLPTRRRQGCCEEESISDFVGLPNKMGQARRGYECSSSHWWFKCLWESGDFSSTFRSWMVAPSWGDLVTLMEFKASHWPTQLDLLIGGKQASDSPSWQCSHGLPMWNKMWKGLSYSNYGMIKRNLTLLLL